MDKVLKLIFFILSFFLVIIALVVFFGEREEINDDVGGISETDLLSRIEQQYPGVYEDGLIPLGELEGFRLMNLGGIDYGLLPSLWASDKSTPFMHIFDLDGNSVDPTGVYFVDSDYDIGVRFSDKSIDQVEGKRQDIIDFIWKGEGIPGSIPDSVEEDINSRYKRFDNLERVDKLTTNMEHELNSITYLFHPTESNRKLVLYHAGHSLGGFGDEEGDIVIQFFLNKGYSVLAFSLPLSGLNTGLMDSHEDFLSLDSNSFSSMKFFVHPVYVSLNYIEKEYGFESVYMVGISGGGWVTTLYAAIDERVEKSYPVAGSLPLIFPSERDYEQTNFNFYGVIVDYLDLYILGSYDRRQVQILNLKDSCCFKGIQYEFFPYESGVNNVLAGRGDFIVRVDRENEKHIISDDSLDFILNDMERD